MTNEEALSKVKGYLTNLLSSEDYDEVEEIIKALEPKTGYQIYEGEGSGYKKWHCPNCKTLVRNSLKPWYKFCPNCGVKMVDVSDINDGELSEIPKGSESEKV